MSYSLHRLTPLHTTYIYISFHQLPQQPNKKTHVWSCRNNSCGAELGQIRWHARWRQYCYYPTTETVLSGGCLDDISNFLSQLAALLIKIRQQSSCTKRNALLDLPEADRLHGKQDGGQERLPI